MSVDLYDWTWRRSNFMDTQVLDPEDFDEADPGLAPAAAGPGLHGPAHLG